MNNNPYQPPSSDSSPTSASHSSTSQWYRNLTATISASMVFLSSAMLALLVLWTCYVTIFDVNQMSSISKRPVLGGFILAILVGAVSAAYSVKHTFKLFAENEEQTT